LLRKIADSQEPFVNDVNGQRRIGLANNYAFEVADEVKFGRGTANEPHQKQGGQSLHGFGWDVLPSFAGRDASILFFVSVSNEKLCTGYRIDVHERWSRNDYIIDDFKRR
jgi:hypothetical protein